MDSAVSTVNEKMHFLTEMTESSSRSDSMSSNGIVCDFTGRAVFGQLTLI